MDLSLSAAAASARGCVVQVLPGDSGGAGVVFSRAGELVIVTNAHVARGSPGQRVQIASHRRRIHPAIIEQADTRSDLALLRLPSRAAVEPGELTAATLGHTTALRPGQLLLAIGHPFGLANAVTAGVVHAVGPLRSEWAPKLPSGNLAWVQADIMLAPGNSGGPLLDIEGRVVGINTMVVGGLALAVPVPEIQALLQGRGEAIPA
ncbi:MAG TPA: trypsin-like peptidase domain-containing protein [Gemmatimonadales bacterium]